MGDGGPGRSNGCDAGDTRGARMRGVGLTRSVLTGRLISDESFPHRSTPRVSHHGLIRHDKVRQRADLAPARSEGGGRLRRGRRQATGGRARGGRRWLAQGRAGGQRGGVRGAVRGAARGTRPAVRVLRARTRGRVGRGRHLRGGVQRRSRAQVHTRVHRSVRGT